MNDKDRVRYEACKRSPQFGKDYKSQIPNGSMLETAFADLDTKVNETATGEQSAAIGESGQQFNIKRVSREPLFDLLQTPADAARAAEPENPERFRFNRNLPDAELLAKANSFTSCDAAEEALLNCGLRLHAS